MHNMTRNILVMYCSAIVVIVTCFCKYSLLSTFVFCMLFSLYLTRFGAWEEEELSSRFLYIVAPLYCGIFHEIIYLSYTADTVCTVTKPRCKADSFVTYQYFRLSCVVCV